MGEKRVIEQVASNEVYNDDWFLKDSPTQDTSKISATNLKAILGADGTLALEEIANAIAEEYDSTHTYYNTGLVFHEGVLYQCTATSTTGTWDSTKWNVVDIKDLLDNVSTNIGYLWNIISNTIAGNYDTSSTYNTGDYAIYSIKLYRCKDDDVTGAWNSSKWEEVNIPEYIDYVLENAGIVKDVKVDGTSVVNASGVAEITLPDVPVQDVQVKTDSTYDSVVDASGNAKIDLSSVTAYGEVPNLPQAIATFKDGADAPMKSLKVAIEPQQEGSGDPSPTNIRPISGWTKEVITRCGKNLLDPNVTGADGYYDDNGEYHTSQNTGYYGPIPVNASTQYSTKLYAPKWTEQGGATATFAVYFFDKNNNWISRTRIDIGQTSVSGYTNTLTFATPATCSKIYLQAPNGNASSTQLDLSQSVVTLGDVADYEPYAGTTYTIDLDGTRYGGELDVVNGVLTVDRVIKTFTESDLWVISSNNAYLSVPDGDDGKFISDILEYGDYSGNAKMVGSNHRFYVWDAVNAYNITTREEAQSFFKDHTVVYYIATPLTIQLTPTAVKSLRGVNNVFANTGDITDAEYVRDATATINDILARLEALEG